MTSFLLIYLAIGAVIATLMYLVVGRFDVSRPPISAVRTCLFIAAIWPIVFVLAIRLVFWPEGWDDDRRD